MFRAHAMDKVELLSRILQAEGRGLTMVFCRTKRTAQKVSDELASAASRPAPCTATSARVRASRRMRAFRNGKVDVLVATDVAARGIDIEGVTHVVNYQCPEDEKTYLHRIGRTARAGASGIAVTFVDWDDIPRWTLINKALGLAFDEPAGDLLHVRPPLRGARHPGSCDRGAAQGGPHPRRTRRRSGRGPRRDRHAQQAPRELIAWLREWPQLEQQFGQ